MLPAAGDSTLLCLAFVCCHACCMQLTAACLPACPSPSLPAAGWGPGQLESECARGVWLPVSASRHVVLRCQPKGAAVDAMWHEVAEVRCCWPAVQSVQPGLDQAGPWQAADAVCSLPGGCFVAVPLLTSLIPACLLPDLAPCVQLAGGDLAALSRGVRGVPDPDISRAAGGGLLPEEESEESEEDGETSGHSSSSSSRAGSHSRHSSRWQQPQRRLRLPEADYRDGAGI